MRRSKIIEKENEVVVEDSHVLRESEKAVLCDVSEVGEQWIPKSQITTNSEVWKPGQERGDLAVTKWFARERGWIS